MNEIIIALFATIFFFILLLLARLEYLIRNLRKELEEFKYECGERQYIADNANDFH